MGKCLKSLHLKSVILYIPIKTSKNRVNVQACGSVQFGLGSDWGAIRKPCDAAFPRDHLRYIPNELTNFVI